MLKKITKVLTTLMIVLLLTFGSVFTSHINMLVFIIGILILKYR